MKVHFVQGLITFSLDANASPKVKRSPTIILKLSSSLFLLTFLEGDLPSESPLCVLPLKYSGRERRTQLF